MPKITKGRIGVALDMHGCPNKCRHCYLGFGTNKKIAEDDLRWMVARFRDYLANNDTNVESLAVGTHFREPDFSDDYRRLHELTGELGDGAPSRFELLSIWRLAHDDQYAEWAKSVGPDACQISFFGMEETNDWFYRRKGAFRDALKATEKLLSVGMKPRWQIFLTKKLLPEVDDLMRLIEKLRLRERVQKLGGEFQLFIHTPGPDFEGRKIEYLRPTLEEVKSLPSELLESAKKHLGKEFLWKPESELYASIMEGKGTVANDEMIPNVPDIFWFFVTNDWNMYSNAGTLEPWWRLGNLKTDDVATVMRRFERDEILGLNTLYHYPGPKLAQRFGDPEGRKIYSGVSDLLSLYQAKYCEETWRE